MVVRITEFDVVLKSILQRLRKHTTVPSNAMACVKREGIPSCVLQRGVFVLDFLSHFSEATHPFIPSLSAYPHTREGTFDTSFVVPSAAMALPCKIRTNTSQLSLLLYLPIGTGFPKDFSVATSVSASYAGGAQE